MTSSRRGGSWFVWLALAVLVSLAVVLVIVIAVGMRGLRDRLTPQKLEEARIHWDTHGPSNYTLIYTTQVGNDSRVDRVRVKVQNKRAVAAGINDQAVATDSLRFYGMHKLFDYMEGFQKLDKEKPETAPFTRASFDPATGALKRYSRRELGEKQIVEINVESLIADE